MKPAQAAGNTHVGRVRRGNEDSFVADAEHGVFLVADGMGGHAAGEVASAIAAETAGRMLADAAGSGISAEQWLPALQDAFEAVQARIVDYCALNPRARGMGTTLTVCVLSADGNYHIGHIGDSRAYRLSSGGLEQLTTDHTWVQREVDEGRLTPEEARTHPLSHVLVRVLVSDMHEVPDLLRGTLQPGDRLLLATDGLTGMLADEEIAAILRQPLPAHDLVDELIGAANNRGGVDNITAVLIGPAGS